MYENLKKLRKEMGKTQAEFAESLGFPQTTYAGYEKGTSDPRSDFWIAVATKYDVSIDYLMGFTDDPKRSKYATPSKLDEKYAALDDVGRRVVDAVLDIEGERAPDEPSVVAERPQKVIPLFPAAAGPGEPVNDTAFDDYNVDADSKAEFAVRISGDSMEPEMRDGEVVLCVKRRPEVGEIGVMSVNGFLLVKQFISDGRNIFLRSINRDRASADLDIWESSNDTVQCFGTVIHRRIPLVEQ